MTDTVQPSFGGLRVVSFESRRSVEIAELIRRHGGAPVSAPSMREIPLTENPPALEFARRLRNGEIDVAIFLTGVGTRALATAVSGEMPREELTAALRKIPTVARGPKPLAALRELGLAPTIAVGEPNTWKEVLAALDERLPVAGTTVALQEYGESNDELLDGLAARGATVLRVPVYRWALPEDLEPLREAIRRIRDGTIDVVLVTSAQQIENLFEVAAAEAASLTAALGRVVVASIGPIASAALRRRGIQVDVEPEHPKMGHLVRSAAGRAPRMLAERRRTLPS